jgi:hypothetical protein
MDITRGSDLYVSNHAFNKTLLGTLQYYLLNFIILCIMPILEPLRKFGAHYAERDH